MRTTEPSVLLPVHAASELITPADRFFVRDHFPEPEVSLDEWRLTVDGRVAHRLELSLADILESPIKDRQATLECAGNPVGGTGVANALWQGVPIAHVLDRASVTHDAIAVLLEGADTGRLTENAPELPYCQIVTLDKCERPESLLAFKLNSRFLPRKSGFPVRALFPGWYGMVSVKWLRRMTVLGPSDRPGNFQESGINTVYNRVVRDASGKLMVTRLAEVQVKSIISWPPDNTRFAAGQYEVRGFAWTGTAVVSNVGFSADAGRTWVPARLAPRSIPFCWVPWTYAWQAAAGEHVLMSRATDDAGNIQPLVRDPSRQDDYELNLCPRVRCIVR